MNNNIINILAPKLCGEVIALGNWDGSDDIRDLYDDIAKANSFLPSSSKPYYILMNSRTAYYTNAMTIEREPFYRDILIYLFDVRPSEVLMLKDRIMRTSNKVPDNIALLVSDCNDIVIIHTDGPNL